MGIHDANADALILGLDPGRDKIGFAFAGRDRQLRFSGIFPAKEKSRFWAALRQRNYTAAAFAPWLKERTAIEDGPSRGEKNTLAFIVLGNGTCSGDLANSLAGKSGESLSVLPSGGIVTVDERGTTLEARKLYWRLHRPAWWQRFLPEGLRVPPRPLDDLAAWAIVLRALDRNLDLISGRKP